MILLSIWLALVPCSPLQLPDMISTQSVVEIYSFTDKRLNAFTNSRQ